MTHAQRLQFQGKRLLIVDDSPEQLRNFAEIFRARGFEVATLLGKDDPAPTPHDGDFDGVFSDEAGFRAQLASRNVDAMLTDRQIISRVQGLERYFFWGEEATQVALTVKPGLPVLMHTSDTEASRDADSARRFAGQGEKYMHATGGRGLFAKGSTDAICDRFSTAFALGRSVR